MTSIIRANLDNAEISVPWQVKLSTPSRRRWCSAFVVIYCTRAFKDVLTSLESKIPRDSYQRIADDENNMPPEGLSDGAVIIDVVEKHSYLYSIDQPTLTNLVKEKNLEKLDELGGVQGIATFLNTNVHNGINGDDSQDILCRTEAFGENTYHKPPSKSFLHFVWEAFKDPTISILLVSATISLGFGIKKQGPKEGWYDGGSIFLAVFLVIFLSTIRNFRQSRQFDKHSKVGNNIQIEVVRNGRRQQISVFEIVVGDVVCLKVGDQVPADGLFLDGHSLRVDESNLTGERDRADISHNQNPFLISGTKVAEGYARMLVTSVGKNTTWGDIMISCGLDSDDKTPLQDQLNKLTSAMRMVGSVLALVTPLVYYLTVNENSRSRHGKLNEVINVLVEFIVAAVDIAVAAIPGGLPLAFTLTLSYSLNGMMADQVMVRKLSAFETLNSVTTICMDMTATLTQSKMEVTKFWLGKVSVEKESYNTIAPSVLDLLHHAVSLNNSTSSNSKDLAFSVIPIERAILSWAESELNWELEQVKQNCSILLAEAFISEKRSGVLIKKNLDSTIHVHWKGAAEQILAMCAHYYDLDGEVVALDDNERKHFTQIIEGMAASGLQCIAFAHKQILEANHDKGDKRKWLLENSLILLGIAGLKDPRRPCVKDTVRDCKRAGVNFKVITGDNVLTAKALAMECGILGRDGLVIEGVEFRNYADDEQKKKVDEIVVMAGSSPLDRQLMVKCLKAKGHVVAVVGNGTDDVPALKEADIGLLGAQGPEIAKANTGIIILDDNFASVVTALRWGRCVHNNIQKFTQFQLTANIAGLVINFVTKVSARVPLTVLELSFVNLLINPLGALALATERPMEVQMWKPPVGRTEPLVTNIMWRNLLGQTLFQITVILVLQFKGETIFHVSQEVNDTLVYNTFVLCQVFNQFNARRLASMNIFEGVHRNKLFLGIVAITITLQMMMVEFFKRFAHTERLNWEQWTACTGIAAASWPIACLIKLIPVPETPFGTLVRFG